MRRVLICSIGLVAFIPLALSAQPTGGGWEVMYDDQVTIRLKDAQFTAGTRHLAWLLADDQPAKTKAKTPTGPEYLEFREEKSTGFKDGIITYIPVASLQRLEYEHDKKLIRAVVKQAGGKDLTLVGTTKYAGINKFSLDGTAEKAAVAVAGALQFQDGLMKTPFRGFTQLGAKAVEMPTGRGAVVIAKDVAAGKKKEVETVTHPVQGLTPLYRVGTGQKLANVLMFQKVGQLDVAKIATLRQLPPADKKQTLSHDYEVTQIGGDMQKLTLLDETQLGENQKATLVGLVGRVPSGYKLFPPHTIAEVRFDGKSE